MASDDLARLRAMEAAMSAGPWEHDPVTGGVGPLCYVEHDGDYRRADPAQIAPDLTAIAALRNVAPELLAVAEAADRACALGAGPTEIRELWATLVALRAKVPR